MLCPSLTPCQVAARLALLESRLSYPEVVVVGGGYAGVELAAAVADRLKGRARIKLVTSTPDILDGSPEASAGVHRVCRKGLGARATMPSVVWGGAGCRAMGHACVLQGLQAQPRR